MGHFFKTKINYCFHYHTSVYVQMNYGRPYVTLFNIWNLCNIINIIQQHAPGRVRAANYMQYVVFCMQQYNTFGSVLHEIDPGYCIHFIDIAHKFLYPRTSFYFIQYLFISFNLHGYDIRSPWQPNHKWNQCPPLYQAPILCSAPYSPKSLLVYAYLY